MKKELEDNINNISIEELIEMRALINGKIKGKSGNSGKKTK